LHELATNLCEAKSVGRHIARSGDNERKMSASDQLELCSLLDRQKVSLLLFVAGSMLRIPCVRPLDNDVVALSASLADLRQQDLYIRSRSVASKSAGDISEESLQHNVGSSDGVLGNRTGDFYPENGTRFVVDLPSSVTVPSSVYPTSSPVSSSI
jgi:hypothetical protein